MIRHTLFLMAILGTAATAIAAAHPDRFEPLAQSAAHETVIEKNSPFPVLGPLSVDECAVEDCSDVQS